MGLDLQLHLNSNSLQGMNCKLTGLSNFDTIQARNQLVVVNWILLDISNQDCTNCLKFMTMIDLLNC